MARLKFSEGKLRIIWKQLTNKKMPKIRIHIMNENDFNQLRKLIFEIRGKDFVARCHETDLKEHGKIIKEGESSGFVVYDDGIYHVFIAESFRGRRNREIRKIIDHELRHIIKGEAYR